MPHVQDDVIVVGDGPTGLQAALLLSKNGIGVHVLGRDATGANRALLRNVLTLDGAPGPTFMEAARAHAERYGAHLHRQTASALKHEGAGWTVATQEGNTFAGRYVVLAHGSNLTLAKDARLRTGADGVDVDPWGRTSLDNVYAGGGQTRGARSQLAISLGDGAAIAVDILSRERGRPTHDYDVLPGGESVRPAQTAQRT